MDSRIGIEGVLVGSYSDFSSITGCTVFIFPEGATASAIIMGGAPGTRSMDSLFLDRNPTKVYGILFTGGSAFGIDAAKGVVQFLKENNIGLRIDHLTVPVVPTAVIFDLFVGRPTAPTAENAYAACSKISLTVQNGSFGAGTGAVVGKLNTARFGTKGGQGYSEIEIYKGVRVGCFTVANAFGDIKKRGRIIAGARDPQSGKFIDTKNSLIKGIVREIPGIYIQNTTLSLIITDAKLNKAQAYRVAAMALSGMARVIDPVWTIYDGDIVIVASVGEKKVDISSVGAAAALTLENSILVAISHARGMGGIPSASEIGSLTQ